MRFKSKYHNDHWLSSALFSVEPLKHGLSYQFVLVYRLTVGTMVHEGILMYHLYQSPVGLVHTAHTKRYAMNEKNNGKKQRD
ncbi:hypothetical protein GW17_00007588 [Ensete ventricosum]|nr:hypothetical protein GW17_00007588 [Ensete ventricosum]